MAWRGVGSRYERSNPRRYDAATIPFDTPLTDLWNIVTLGFGASFLIPLLGKLTFVALATIVEVTLFTTVAGLAGNFVAAQASPRLATRIAAPTKRSIREFQDVTILATYICSGVTGAVRESSAVVLSDDGAGMMVRLAA